MLHIYCLIDNEELVYKPKYFDYICIHKFLLNGCTKSQFKYVCSIIIYIIMLFYNLKKE